MKKETANISFRITPKLKKIISIHAQVLNFSLSDYIKFIISSYLSGHKPTKNDFYRIYETRQLNLTKFHKLDKVINQLNSINIQATGAYTNLNQLTKKVNQGNQLDLEELDVLRHHTNNIDQELKKMEDEISVLY